MKTVIQLLPEKESCCLLIRSAFDAAFCDQIITAKKDSFQEAKTHYPSSYRNNQRQVVDNEMLAKKLFAEIKKYIPSEIVTQGMSLEEEGHWQLDSLNTRIRICRYLPQQYFNKHLDGVHFVSKNKQSKLTFMIYLNGSEDFSGGKTLFFDSKESDAIIGAYQAQKGDLIIFDHNLWHSGAMVLEGEKYILRSDIIYTKKQKTTAANATSVFCAEGHLGYVWTLTQLKDMLVTSGRDKKIKVWSKTGEKLTEMVGHKNSVLSLLAFSEDQIISASRDGSIKIWRIVLPTHFQLTQDLYYHDATVLCLCKMDEQSFLSGGADGWINNIRIDGTLLARIKAHDEWIWDVVAFTENYYASISEEGSLKIWDIKEATLLTSWTDRIPINAIAVDGENIFLGRFDGSLVQLLFNADEQTVALQAHKQLHRGIIRSVVVDEKNLYTASEDSTLKIWYKNDLKLKATHVHQNFVQDIALVDDAVITVAYDGRIRRWARKE